jgi:lysophospholipase L1-like esterase
MSLIDPYEANPYVVKMRPYLYAHIPGSVYIQTRSSYQVKYEINSQGFRGPEISSQKEQRRLLVIGDSVVEGHGNEFTDTFSYLLGENLQASGWEVINGGVQGGSPIYYAANMERYLSLQPDAMVIVLYENDLYGDRVREAEYFDLPYLEDSDRLLKRSAATDLLSMSRLYGVIRREWQKQVDTPVEQLINHNRATWVVDQEQVALFQASPQLVSPAFIKQQWEMSRPYLDYVVAVSQEHHLQLFIANLSTMPPDSPYSVPARYVDEQIAAWAKEKGLPFLSLLPIMAEIYQEKPLSEIIIEDDGHPTPATHALIETALRPWLLEQLKVE